MPEITLRLARAEDASKLAEVHMTARRVSMPFLPHLHTEAETAHWIADFVLPRMEVWIAQADGEAAAYLALEDEMVDQLYVAPRWQRQGIGSRLMDKAKQLRPGHLRLYCFAMNAPARAFYEARGFVPIEFTEGERNEEKLPDVLYQWLARG